MEEFERKLHDDGIPMKIETSIIKKSSSWLMTGLWIKVKASL